jgi:voltage-gated potassium channel Kch
MIFFRIRRALRRHRERHATRHGFLTLFVTLVVLTLVSAAFIMRVEGMEYGDSLWQVWQTLTTVGYGDVPSKTLWGRVLTVVYGTLGIVVLSQAFSMAVEHGQARREAYRGGSMRSPQRGGHIIVGYPGEQRTALLIHELRQGKPELPICIVDAHLSELPIAVRELPDVHFVRGPLILPDTYVQAGIERAASASILPSAVLEGDADAQTVVQIQIMKRLAPSLRIVYILADIRNESLFYGLGASRVVSDMLFQAVVQEISDPGVAEAMESMLSNIKGADPKTVDPLGTMGWTWGQLCGALHARNSRLSAASIVPYALLRGIDADVAPDYNERIGTGDRLILTSREDFDWAQVVATLDRTGDSVPSGG